jgi:hypothetical protein
MKNTIQTTEKQSLRFTDGTIRAFNPITETVKPYTIPGLQPLKGNLDKQMIALIDWFNDYRIKNDVTHNVISAAESVTAQTLAKIIGGIAGTFSDDGQHVVYVSNSKQPYVVFISKLVDKVICDTDVQQTAVAATAVTIN